MEAVTEQRHREAVERGKYAPLYRHLTREPGTRVAHLVRSHRGDSGLSASKLRPLSPPLVGEPEGWERPQPGPRLATAGWKTRSVDLDAETLVFELDPARERAPRVPMSIDELIPVRDIGPWPEGFTVSREQIYEDRV